MDQENASAKIIQTQFCRAAFDGAAKLSMSAALLAVTQLGYSRIEYKL